MLMEIEFAMFLFTVVLELVMSISMKLLRCTPQVLELVMFMVTAVLQSMPSPLEMVACIAVVDVSEAKTYFQVALAVTSLAAKKSQR